MFGFFEIVVIFAARQTKTFIKGSLAQLVQSIPTLRREDRSCWCFFYCSLCIVFNIGSLAQLVQSICLTSRGSLVRTQQFPQMTKRSDCRQTFFILHKFRVSFACKGIYQNKKRRAKRGSFGPFLSRHNGSRSTPAVPTG